MASEKTYDFIIVGGGTAGCLLANRLSHSKSAPTVLLLEAGVNPTGDYLTSPAHRFAAAFARPDLNYGYVSEPEPALNGRTIPYARGKGLGGSSILNFGLYLYGSSEDYDRWAELVDDDEWAWSSVRESFRTIENYDVNGVQDYRHLADPSTEPHGTSGGMNVSLPTELEESVAPKMEALIASGEKLCLDPNSGDPTGFSIFPSGYGKGGRCTSAMAHLGDPPANLEVWTDAAVRTLVFDGTGVVGVETTDGRKASASKEVILCCGTIDTPRLLLLNGIGPRSELEALGIASRKDLPGVGKGLQDHVAAFMSIEIDGSLYSHKLDSKSHQSQDEEHGFAISSQMWGGFLKLPGLQGTAEFKDLPRSDQNFLSRSSVPHFEFVSNSMPWPPGTQVTPGNQTMTVFGCLMNPHSKGSITLRSKNIEDQPIIRFNFLTHPYDALVMRETIRKSWALIMENARIEPHLKKTILAPASLSDADIDSFCRANAVPIAHANGTVRMGKEIDGGSVDSNGRVYGIQGLRVADLSICPLTTNNHTQTTAYLVGQKISEKMIREYGLNK